MDNIQLCYIDNEINKIDKMKQGDVIYKNGMELLVVLSYDHGEPCRGCFFYKDKKCGSERLIKCWNCNKEYIFTVIRENDTTELDKMTKRHKEAYEKMLNITKRIERECQKYVIWDTVNRLAKKWEKDGKRLWLYSASGVLTVMMHGDREDNPIPEMLPNAGTNPDNIITTISGIGNDGGDW